VVTFRGHVLAVHPVLCLVLLCRLDLALSAISARKHRWLRYQHPAQAVKHKIENREHLIVDMEKAERPQCSCAHQLKRFQGCINIRHNALGVQHQADQHMEHSGSSRSAAMGHNAKVQPSP
jgi:hypothetical protein